jgi:hypothetical protein
LHIRLAFPLVLPVLVTLHLASGVPDESFRVNIRHFLLYYFTNNIQQNNFCLNCMNIEYLTASFLTITIIMNFDSFHLTLAIFDSFSHNLRQTNVLTLAISKICALSLSLFDSSFSVSLLSKMLICYLLCFKRRLLFIFVLSNFHCWLNGKNWQYLGTCNYCKKLHFFTNYINYTFIYTILIWDISCLHFCASPLPK